MKKKFGELARQMKFTVVLREEKPRPVSVGGSEPAPHSSPPSTQAPEPAPVGSEGLD